MRLFSMLCKHSRKPQNPKKVPLATPRLPLALRDRVSGSRISRESSAAGLKEMQNVISKLSQNDWNQEFCKTEVKAMCDANTASYLNYLRQKKENRIGVIKPGPQLDPIPLTKYLKSRFPISTPNPFEEKIQDLATKQRKK